MNKKHVFAIASIIVLAITLSLFIIFSFELSAITIVAFSFIVIGYLRAKEFFNDRAPGKYYTYANYVIGYTIAGAIFLVNYNLTNHHDVDQSTFISIYAAELITGLVFTVWLFLKDHKNHRPNRISQKTSDIVFAVISTVLFIALLVFSLIVDTNFTM